MKIARLLRNFQRKEEPKWYRIGPLKLTEAQLKNIAIELEVGCTTVFGVRYANGNPVELFPGTGLYDRLRHIPLQNGVRLTLPYGRDDELDVAVYCEGVWIMLPLPIYNDAIQVTNKHIPFIHRCPVLTACKL